MAASLGLEAPSEDTEVTGITLDSAGVIPGDLYAALPGSRAHGADFAAAAIDAGANAIVTDDAGAAKLDAAGGEAAELPRLVVDDLRARLGELSAAVYGHPARSLKVVGITGTNGKTTTAYLLEACLRANGRRTGLIGTVETRVLDERLPSARTTPEAPALQGLFALMVERGVEVVVMEVSSHALALGRVDGVVFDVAGFTNLTQDHLDFHKDMDDYFAVKASLFTPQRSRRGVVDLDGEYGRRLLDLAGVPIVSVGRTGADWTSSEVEATAGGSSFTATHGGETRRITVGLPGPFNVANALLASAMLSELGEPLAGTTALGEATVPGRMDPVRAGQPFTVVVDYAHTPDAVATALSALRSATPGRVIAVLGCGGDRDAAKRPLMGAAGAQGADILIVTDDNPRSEEPGLIRRATLDGAEAALARGEVSEVGDRRDAIRTAVAQAEPGDSIAILGKGHETYQEVAGQVTPFDDKEVAAEAIAEFTRVGKHASRRASGHPAPRLEPDMTRGETVAVSGGDSRGGAT